MRDPSESSNTSWRSTELDLSWCPDQSRCKTSWTMQCWLVHKFSYNHQMSPASTPRRGFAAWNTQRHSWVPPLIVQRSWKLPLWSFASWFKGYCSDLIMREFHLFSIWSFRDRCHSAFFSSFQLALWSSCVTRSPLPRPCLPCFHELIEFSSLVPSPYRWRLLHPSNHQGGIHQLHRLSCRLVLLSYSYFESHRSPCFEWWCLPKLSRWIQGRESLPDHNYIGCTSK